MSNSRKYNQRPTSNQTSGTKQKKKKIYLVFLFFKDLVSFKEMLREIYRENNQKTLLHGHHICPIFCVCMCVGQSFP